MAIYQELVQKALTVLNVKEAVLHTYSMDEDLAKVVIKYKKNYYTGLTVSAQKEKSAAKADYNDLKQMLEQSTAYNTTKRAYGLAAVNALGQLLNAQTKLETQKDLRQSVLNFLKINASKEHKIVFIGHLKPVVSALKKESYKVEVFCRQEIDEKDGVYNDIYEYESLESADIAVITGATLQGSTIDAILKFTQKAKIVLLAGFSAGGFLPWYKEYGITHVASLYTPVFVKSQSFEDIFANECYLVPL